MGLLIHTWSKQKIVDKCITQMQFVNYKKLYIMNKAFTYIYSDMFDPLEACGYNVIVLTLIWMT